jgi:hypothetical protein
MWPGYQSCRFWFGACASLSPRALAYFVLIALLYVSGSDMTVPLLAMGGPSTNHPLSTFIWSVLLAPPCMMCLQIARAVAADRGELLVDQGGSGLLWWCVRGIQWWCHFVVNSCSVVTYVVYVCVRARLRMMSREYMATAFLVLTVFATVVDKQSRHADSGVKVSLPLSACRAEEAVHGPCA